MRRRFRVGFWAGFCTVAVACGPGRGAQGRDEGADAAGFEVPDAEAGEILEDLATEHPDVSTTTEPGSCEPASGPFPVRPTPPFPATRSFLRVQGRDLVDESGRPVALRGVNFGSWLLIENWIAGIGRMDEGDLLKALDQQAEALGVSDLLQAAKAETALEWTLEQTAHRVLVERWRKRMMELTADDASRAAVEALWAWFDGQPWIFEERSLFEYLARRFGPDGAQQAIETFRDHFITERDVQRVAELGLNAIRVPVFYLALETDQKGTENHFLEQGFRRLDTLALWARKHGVYLILDLHGAPGGQSTAWHTGLWDGGALWTRPECIERTARVWKALASYFAGDPHIAAYDLLNEPMSVENAQQYAGVHDAIYRAIREVDPDHVVMIEDGYRAPSVLVSPKEMGWTNAMFSIHLYVDPPKTPGAYAKSLDEALRLAESYYEYSARYDVPLLLGEFNPETNAAWGPAAMDEALAVLNRRGVHWTVWTWKYAGSDSMWGVWRRPAEAANPVDVADADLSGVLQGFRGLDSEQFVENADYAEALKARAADAVRPLALGEIHRIQKVQSLGPGPVRVGTARRAVTPAFEPYENLNPEENLVWDPGEPFEDLNGNQTLDTFWIGGMGPRQPTGVHDDLWARAVALAFGPDAVVLVSVDALGLSMKRVERIRTRVLQAVPAGIRLDPERVVVAATHTHAGPDTIGIFGPDSLVPGWDEAYLAQVEQEASSAAVEALASLRDAHLQFAHAECGAACVMDADPPVHTDPSVDVLVARDAASDEVLATLVTVANHPEALWSRNTLISSDYPHVLRERIEQAVGGLAIDFSGALGLMQTPAKDVPEGIARMEYLGNQYADVVLDALANAVEVPDGVLVTFGYATAPVALENVALFVAVQMDIAEGYKDYLYWVEDDPRCGGMGCMDLPVAVLRLGDLATLVTAPGELVPELVTGEITVPSELGSDLVFPDAPHEPALLDHLATPGRFVVGLANAEVGYLYPKCTYAPAAIFSQQHGPGPNAAMDLMTALASLLDRVNQVHVASAN